MSEHLVAQQRERKDPMPQAHVGSGIKNLLLHIVDDEFCDQRIECGLTLARAFLAHLTCIHVTPIEAYVAFDRFGGILVMDEVMRAVDEGDAEIRRKVEERLAREDISWSYEQVTGGLAQTLLSRAALSDLLICAREPPHHDYPSASIHLLGDLISSSRTAVFIPSFPQESFDPSGIAIIAWDGSIEAANAVRSALGLLSLAREVKLVWVREGKKETGPSFPATDSLEYLSRHEIHAQLITLDPPAHHGDQGVVSGMIVAEAIGSQASYIVMGGYSHRRLGEYVFGGVTRTLLKECPVPLVVAH